jgi:hypothetical protein
MVCKGDIYEELQRWIEGNEDDTEDYLGNIVPSVKRKEVREQKEQQAAPLEGREDQGDEQGDEQGEPEEEPEEEPDESGEQPGDRLGWPDGTKKVNQKGETDKEEDEYEKIDLFNLKEEWVVEKPPF